MAERWAGRLRDVIRQKRGRSFALVIASLVFTAAMLIAYIHTGVSTFTPVLSGKVVALLWVCVGIGVLLSVIEVKLGKYALYLLLLWMWLEFLFYNASYISNVLVGIDGNSFGAGFLLTVLFGLLAWLAALLSAITQKGEIGSADPAGAEGEEA